MVRSGLVGVVVALGVVVAAYLPYVLGSRGSVLGYLSGYLTEEGYDEAGARDRYVLLRLLLPDAWALPATVVALAAVLVHVLRNGDQDRRERGALLLTGAAFLLLTPGYPWYALLPVALAALAGQPEWLGVAAAGAVVYLGGPATPAYAAAALLCLVRPLQPFARHFAQPFAQRLSRRVRARSGRAGGPWRPRRRPGAPAR
ncbi:hypothetical protein HII36_45540 [Nonomuraea sp. NN258]|nr:hypothetical protein [Nonomuraea antri]